MKSLGLSALHYPAQLRHELSVRNLKFAKKHSLQYTPSRGATPAIVYSPNGDLAHGNFLNGSYRAISTNSAWARRYAKRHSQSRSLPPCEHGCWKELDSCNSSDALLMNIFCYPTTLKSAPVRRLLGLGEAPECHFGFKAKVPLINDRADRTEVDLLLHHGDTHPADSGRNDLLIEAKLTESDFQSKDAFVLDRYRDFREVFDLRLLPKVGGKYISYQLIRNALAAHVTDKRFCVMLDARRPDLIEAWHQVQRAVKPVELRIRCQLLTWQELSTVLPRTVQGFLAEKYGIE